MKIITKREWKDIKERQDNMMRAFERINKSYGKVLREVHEYKVVIDEILNNKMLKKDIIKALEDVYDKSNKQ